MNRTITRRAAATLGVAVFLTAPSPAAAQHEGHAEHVSEYAGQEGGDIPSLSQTEIDGLRGGAGMGLARAAELNHFPGPKHVLEMEVELELTPEQRDRVTRIREVMEREAIELGERIIEGERELGMRFRHGHIDETSLATELDRIADLRGDLRFVHLRAHLETARVLTAAQIDAYDTLRGYAPRE